MLLFDGELSPVDHGAIDLLSERAAAALTGQPLEGCVAAMEQWPSRAWRTRLPWLDALACFDAAAAWGPSVLAARDAWIEARVAPSLVVSAPVADTELLQWVSWTRDVGVMGAWKRAGWTSSEARRLSSMDMTPEESCEWRAAGLDVGLILESVSVEVPAAMAGAWWQAGFQPWAADLLVTAGVSLEEAQALKRELGTAEAVVTQLSPF